MAVKSRHGLHTDQHRWELLGNYSVFTVVMVIYRYVDRIGELLLPPIISYIVYNQVSFIQVNQLI